MWPPGTVPWGDGKAVQSPMTRDPQGIWEITIATLDTIHTLHFVVTDGVNWDNNNWANWDILFEGVIPQVKIPVKFILDTRSSRFTAPRPVTRVNLAGTFNAWSTTATPMADPDGDGMWTTTVELEKGIYEYKFVVDGSWFPDPDNPQSTPPYGNSVLEVKPYQTPYFELLSPKDGVVFPDTLTEIPISARVFDSSRGEGLDVSSFRLLVDDTEVSFDYDPTSQILSASIPLPSPGRHELIFLGSDSAGVQGKLKSVFGVRSEDMGYLAVDASEDDNGDGDYTATFAPKGSADILSLLIQSPPTKDSLLFCIRLANVSHRTGLFLIITSTLRGQFVPDPISAELEWVGWEDRGVLVLIAPGGSGAPWNAVYFQDNPLQKLSDLDINPDAIPSDEIRFSLSLADLVDCLGPYSGKWYYAMGSFLMDGEEVYEVTPSDGGIDGIEDPDIYDLAFIDQWTQRRLLAYYRSGEDFGGSALPRIDAVGRGYAAIGPEELGLELPQEPVITFLTQPTQTWHSTWTVAGNIKTPSGQPDSSITRAILFQNSLPDTIPVTDGFFSKRADLVEGENVFCVQATNAEGVTGSSRFLRIVRLVNHSPLAQITFEDAGEAIKLKATASRDPDDDPLSFTWISDDENNPESYNISGVTDSVIVISRPTTPGEYYFELRAIDPDGNFDETRNYFIYHSDGSIEIPNLNYNPQWVRRAVVYEIFLYSFTPEKTLDAAREKLPYIKAMGFNTIWLMPVMRNTNGIDAVGAGYSIVDFKDIDPTYGDLEDFQEFVDEAHQLGLKVILDITPNHVSDRHPWVNDIRLFGRYSRYYNYIEHRLIPHNTMGLGQSLDPEGIYVHYSNWPLANLNLSDVDARTYMIEMFKWWLTEMEVDGFRFDIYWGPSNRYGEATFWRPAREAMKHVKPDIWILAEAPGTGIGTEGIYADCGGGADSGYDWNLYWNGFLDVLFGGSISNLHDRVTNYNYYPGPHAFFLRFLENHDEVRIARKISPIEKTLPAAVVLFTAPGIPMVYAGQEVGFGDGMDEFAGKRFQVDFNDPDRSILQPKYQRLAYVRQTYPAFWTQELKRVPVSEGDVYAYTRPYLDQNGVVVVNFGGSSKTVVLCLDDSNVEISGGIQSDKIYYMSDLYNDTTYVVSGFWLAHFKVHLDAYGAAVFILSDQEEKIILPEIPTPVEKSWEGIEHPSQLVLMQNYPNPFNPKTHIHYQLPGGDAYHVTLKIFNLLGHEIRTVVDSRQSAGAYTVSWNGRDKQGRPVPSGVYLCRLEVRGSKLGRFSKTKKIIVMR